MYIIVRASDNVIVGSAHNPINVKDASVSGRRVYEIDDEDFNPKMIGQKITEYAVVE